MFQEEPGSTPDTPGDILLIESAMSFALNTHYQCRRRDLGVRPADVATLAVAADVLVVAALCGKLHPHAASVARGDAESAVPSSILLQKGF